MEAIIVTCKNILSAGFRIAVILLAVTPGLTYAAGFEYGADLRQNVLLMSWPQADSPLLPRGSFGVSGTNARITAKITGSSFTFNGAVETRAQFSSSIANLSSGGGLFAQGRPLEMADAAIDHIANATTSLSTRLERFDLRWTIGRLDIEAGRQPVTLGTSHFVGILDVLAPFAPGNLDATYKPGIDALRIRSGFGISGQVEIIGAGARNTEDGALLGRVRHTWRGFDFEWVGGKFRQRGFGGVGWEGELCEKGVWGELALFGRRPKVEHLFAGSDHVAFSGVAGVDMNFPYKFKVGISGLYQDFGVRHPKDLPLAYADAPFREGWLFLASAGYGVLTLHRELHPLVQGDLSGIANLVDGSTIWQPRITISAGNNSDLSFYGWLGAGKKSMVSGATVIVRSEFGNTPHGGGFYARWFF